MKKIKNLTAVLMLMLIMLALVGCGIKDVFTPDYEKPIKNMIEGMQDSDLEKFASAYPKFTEIDSYMSEETLKELIKEYEEEYGSNIKMSYKINEKEKLESKDIKEIEEDIKDYYNEDLDISEAYNIELDLTIKGDSKEETDEKELKVIKIEKTWYIYM